METSGEVNSGTPDCRRKSNMSDPQIGLALRTVEDWMI